MDPKNASKTQLSTEKNSFLWEIFNSFIHNGVTPADEEDLRAYITQDLNINVNELCDVVVENLPYILVAFINSWSGWSFRAECLAGQFKKELYFERFKKFLNWKINSFLKASRTPGKSQYLANNLAASLQGNEKSLRCSEQSPVAISIKCPADLLNTLVFTNKGGMHSFIFNMFGYCIKKIISDKKTNLIVL